jgi:dUTP pyrophosphatase
VIIQFYKTDESVMTPVRSNPSDAGLDVFAFLDKDIDGYMLQVMNRSSVASKRSLIVGAHVIDSGYDGEVFINIHNVGQTPQTIMNGQKIAQLVMIPVVSFRASETKEDNIQSL